MTTVLFRHQCVKRGILHERCGVWSHWYIDCLLNTRSGCHEGKQVVYPHKGLVLLKTFPCHDIIVDLTHLPLDEMAPIADDNFKCNWETWVNGHTVTHFGRCQATTQLNYSGYQLQLTHPWLNKIFQDIIKWIFSNANILILSKTSWQSSSIESMDKKSTLYGSWLSTKRNLMLNCVLTRHQNLMGGWFHLGPVTHV